MNELFKIQQELHVSKDLHNNFGNYNYRSAETIYEALKPLLKKYNCRLMASDEIQKKGDRYYLIATLTLTNSEGDITIVKAEARETDSKKGMDAAQITGACSSYARKYALQGMFLLDETKNDIDSADNTKEETKEKLEHTVNTNIIFDKLEGMLSYSEKEKEDIRTYVIVNKYNVNKLEKCYKKIMEKEMEMEKEDTKEKKNE